MIELFSFLARCHREELGTVAAYSESRWSNAPVLKSLRRAVGPDPGSIPRARSQSLGESSAESRGKSSFVSNASRIRGRRNGFGNIGTESPVGPSITDANEFGWRIVGPTLVKSTSLTRRADSALLRCDLSGTGSDLFQPSLRRGHIGSGRRPAISSWVRC